MTEGHVLLVGYGFAGHIHQTIWSDLGFDIVVIDRDECKSQEASRKGFPAYLDLKRCVDEFGKPFIYDICVNTEEHLPVLKDILHWDERANIIIEKPVVNSRLAVEELGYLVTAYPEAKLFVNENYFFSSTVEKIKEKITESHLRDLHIYAEFSKDRSDDTKNGRFIDRHLGVFGIEVSHILAIINSIGNGKSEYPVKILSSSHETAELDHNVSISCHCEGSMVYLTQSDTMVHVHTSLTNSINQHLPHTRPPEQLTEKYRVISITSDSGVTIICQFEPIPQKPRFLSQLTILDHQEVVEQLEVHDDCMMNSLKEALHYFTNGGENPSPISEACIIVNTLLEAAGFSSGTTGQTY